MSAYLDELRKVAETEGLEKAQWIDRTLRAALHRIRWEEEFDQEMDLMGERSAVFLELEEKLGRETALRLFDVCDEMARAQANWKYLEK